MSGTVWLGASQAEELVRATISAMNFNLEVEKMRFTVAHTVNSIPTYF